MQKIIEYLEKNQFVVDLLLQGKVSLVGVSNEEAVAITEAYQEIATGQSLYWRNL